MTEQENYLSVSLDAKWLLGHAMASLSKGDEKCYLAFFKNKDRTKDNEPNYINRTGALWIKKPKPKNPIVKEEDII